MLSLLTPGLEILAFQQNLWFQNSHSSPLTSIIEEKERSWKWYRCPILSWLFNPEGKKDVITLLFIATQFCLNVSLNIFMSETHNFLANLLTTDSGHSLKT